MLDKATVDWFFDNYIDHADRDDWRFAPLNAPDHSGLAPAWIGLAECDPLVDEGVQYADTLRLEHGFRRERYLIAGQQYEVLFYRELPGTVTEPVQQAKETPVVLQEGKVLGLGWRYYVETAMPALQLPNPTGTLRSPRSGA